MFPDDVLIIQKWQKLWNEIIEDAHKEPEYLVPYFIILLKSWSFK